MNVESRAEGRRMTTRELCWVGAVFCVAASGSSAGAQKLPPPPEPVPSVLPATSPPVFPPTSTEFMPGVKDLTPATLPGRSATCAIPEEHEEQRGMLYTSAEYLLLRARRPDQRYALVDPTNNLAPDGQTRNLTPETRSGFRVGLGYRFVSQWDVGTSYTWYRTGDQDGVSAPAGGTLYPLLTRPGLIDNVTDARSDTYLDYQLYDLTVGRWLKADEHLNLRVFGGVQFASIEQDQRGFFNGGDAVNAYTRSASEFDGAGPVLGGEGQWTVGRGVSLFGRGRAGLLYGDQRSSLLETNDGGLSVNTNFNDHFQQVAPMVSLGLGLSWQYNGFRLSGGYEATNWFGLGQTPYLTDDFSEGKVGYRSTDLALEGFFLQLGVDY